MARNESGSRTAQSHIIDPRIRLQDRHRIRHRTLRNTRPRALLILVMCRLHKDRTIRNLLQGIQQRERIRLRSIHEVVDLVRVQDLLVHRDLQLGWLDEDDVLVWGEGQMLEGWLVEEVD